MNVGLSVPDGSIMNVGLSVPDGSIINVGLSVPDDSIMNVGPSFPVIGKYRALSPEVMTLCNSILYFEIGDKC